MVDTTGRSEDGSSGINIRGQYRPLLAHVVELVDTPDLGSGAARRESSSLSMGINIMRNTMGTKRTFEITPEQDDKIAQWIKEHKCSEVAKRALHRSFTYCFTPTGIGDAQKVVCSACKSELVITDVSSW